MSCQTRSVYPFAEIHYQEVPPWGEVRYDFRTASFVLNADGPQAGKMFTISNEDTLAFFYEHMMDSTDVGLDRYEEDAVIVVLLHRTDGIDTLVSNAIPSFRMRVNGAAIRDSVLATYVINAISDRDSIWKLCSDSLFYDGHFNFYSKCGYAKDQWK